MTRTLLTPPSVQTRTNANEVDSATRDAQFPNIVDDSGAYLQSDGGNRIYHNNDTTWQTTT